jgi:hypothetical protein
VRKREIKKGIFFEAMIQTSKIQTRAQRHLRTHNFVNKTQEEEDEREKIHFIKK